MEKKQKRSDERPAPTLPEPPSAAITSPNKQNSNPITIAEQRLDTSQAFQTRISSPVATSAQKSSLHIQVPAAISEKENWGRSGKRRFF